MTAASSTHFTTLKGKLVRYDMVASALVKMITEFRAGKIWVESTAGKGATFYFTLLQKEL